MTAPGPDPGRLDAQHQQSAAPDLARWELLLDAVVTMAANLSLDGLLARIVELASRLVGARYAALGSSPTVPSVRCSRSSTTA